MDEISREAANYLAGFLDRRGVKHVMIYLPFRNELSPLPLLEMYPAAEYYLPRISGGHLTVHPYLSPREKHEYGFEQPAKGAPAVGEETIEAVVVPGIAFDRYGYRLGYGGGFYDRFLSELPLGVFTLGLVPADLVVDRLPRDDWDVPVGWLATERGIEPAELE